MLYSKRRKNLGGGRKKRSNRRSYGLKRYNKYGGNPSLQPIAYNVDTILNDISSFKKNKSHFSRYCCYNMIHILYDKTKDATFYENNLCVFVEFNQFIEYNANRLYLGKMISTYDDYKKYGESVDTLHFQCDLLYSHFKNEEKFNQKMVYNTDQTKYVIIGFLPIEYKETVLDKARELRQS